MAGSLHLETNCSLNTKLHQDKKCYKGSEAMVTEKARRGVFLPRPDVDWSRMRSSILLHCFKLTKHSIYAHCGEIDTTERTLFKCLRWS